MVRKGANNDHLSFVIIQEVDPDQISSGISDFQMLIQGRFYRFPLESSLIFYLILIRVHLNRGFAAAGNRKRTALFF